METENGTCYWIGFSAVTDSIITADLLWKALHSSAHWWHIWGLKKRWNGRSSFSENIVLQVSKSSRNVWFLPLLCRNCSSSVLVQHADLDGALWLHVPVTLHVDIVYFLGSNFGMTSQRKLDVSLFKVTLLTVAYRASTGQTISFQERLSINLAEDATGPDTSSWKQWTFTCPSQFLVASTNASDVMAPCYSNKSMYWMPAPYRAVHTQSKTATVHRDGITDHVPVNFPIWASKQRQATENLHHMTQATPSM